MKIAAFAILAFIQSVSAADMAMLVAAKDVASTTMTATLSNRSGGLLYVWDSLWTLERKEGDQWHSCNLMGLARDLPPTIAARVHAGESRKLTYRLYQFHLPQHSGTFRIVERVFVNTPKSLSMDYMKTGKTVISNEFTLQEKK